MIQASREEAKILEAAMRPVEKSLHTGIAEYHIGGAIYETLDEEKPEAKTCEKAAKHFLNATAEFKNSRLGVQAIMDKAKKMKGNQAFMIRMGDLVNVLESLEKNTSAMANSTKNGKMADAENCYAAASDLAKLAVRMQENAHAFRLKMAVKNKPK